MNIVTVIIGFSGVVAQILLMRELLVQFQGNELVLGVILGNWIIAEATGAYLAARLTDKGRSGDFLFFLSQVLFLLIFPFVIIFARLFKHLLGVPWGQGLGFGVIFGISFITTFALSILHGGLFTLACKLKAKTRGFLQEAVASVYLWETAGTVLGGLFLTYLGLPYLNLFQIVALVGFLNLASLFIFFKVFSSSVKMGRIVFILVLLFLFSLVLWQASFFLQRWTIEKKLYPLEVLESQNSYYGNIIVAKGHKQITFFYNGIPTIVTPYPDYTFVEEFGNFALLFHPQPREVLIIGGGAGGLILQALRHPVKRIDYVELDPTLINLLKRFPSQVTSHELNDSRVHIATTDGIYFLKHTARYYDVILVGMPYPSELMLNRYFTQDFFTLVKKRLAPQGIISFFLPGSTTYMGPELRDLNFGILNALRKVFVYQRIIPGDYNLYLGSDSPFVENPADLLNRQIIQRNIKTYLLVPEYLRYRLDAQRPRWFQGYAFKATKMVNRDLQPLAVFKTLLFWSKQYSPWLLKLLRSFEKINLTGLSFLLLAITLVIILLFKKTSSKNPASCKALAVVYVIFSSGFFGMLISLILFFIFQIELGYLYHWLGLLLSLYMAGSAIGGYLASGPFKRLRPLRFLVGLELALVLSGLLIIGLLKVDVLRPLFQNVATYAMLLFAAGFLSGCEFITSVRFLLKERLPFFSSSARLYATDLLGGCLAAFLSGVLFIPVLGVVGSCVGICLFKLSSIIIVFAARLFNPPQ